MDMELELDFKVGDKIRPAILLRSFDGHRNSFDTNYTITNITPVFTYTTDRIIHIEVECIRDDDNSIVVWYHDEIVRYVQQKVF